MKISNSVLYIIPIFCVSLGACSKPDRSTFVNEVDHYFNNQFDGDDPGGAIIIKKGDEVVFSKGYGLADLNAKTPIEPATLFNLGSISKTFVANAILILHDRQKLSLDDPLEKYFVFVNNPEIGKKVKIKHLLTHTSGLPDLRKVKDDSVFYLTAKDAANFSPILLADSLLFEPGTRYQYSNPAFNALALIIEMVSGEDRWQYYVGFKIFDPSGMKRSAITDGAHPETGVAHGYIKVGDQWVERDYGEVPTFAAAGNGGVWSSVEELALYEEALQRSLFLPAKLVTESRTIQTFDQWSSPDSPSIGWSWFIGKTDDGLKTVGHTGTQGGFNCNYVYVPDQDFLFIVLCNAPRPRNDFAKKILDMAAKENWLN